MSGALYRIREKAVDDLEQIWIYTFKNWSVEQADRYYNQIISEIEFIANNFSSGRSIKHIKEGYRVSRVKSHLIFYKKGPDEIVEVVRVLHQRMDIENRLND